MRGPAAGAHIPQHTPLQTPARCPRSSVQSRGARPSQTRGVTWTPREGQPGHGGGGLRPPHRPASAPSMALLPEGGPGLCVGEPPPRVLGRGAGAREPAPADARGEEGGRPGPLQASGGAPHLVEGKPPTAALGCALCSVASRGSGGRKPPVKTCSCARLGDPKGQG